MGEAICSLCKEKRVYKTEGIPVYRKPGAPGKSFICIGCLNKAYESGEYYQRVTIGGR